MGSRRLGHTAAARVPGRELEPEVRHCATAPLRHCATAPLRHCATARHTLRLPQQPCGERGMPPHVPAQRKPGGGKCPRSAPQHPSPAAAPLICFSSRPRRYSRPNATVTGIWLHVDSYWVGLC